MLHDVLLLSIAFITRSANGRELQTSGAEALVFLARTARLKPCPYGRLAVLYCAILSNGTVRYFAPEFFRAVGAGGGAPLTFPQT